jgi:hypothetical protein
LKRFEPGEVKNLVTPTLRFTDVLSCAVRLRVGDATGTHSLLKKSKCMGKSNSEKGI